VRGVGSGGGGNVGGEGEKTLSVGPLRSDLQRGDRLGQGPGP